MSLADGVALALARSVVVAALAVLAALPVVDLVRRARSRWGPAAVAAALGATWLTPPLLWAYAWSNLALGAVPDALPRTALYVALSALRFLPVAVLVLWVSPEPPLPRSASFCLGLAPTASALGRARFRRVLWRVVHGGGRRVAVAALLVLVLAFQEFELASLMMEPSWTVWLFDAQAGGLPLGESLRLVLGPAAIEVALVLLCAGLLLGGGARSSVAPRHAPAGGPAARSSAVLGAAFVLAALVVMCAVPAAYVMSDMLAGARVVLGEGRMLHELAVSLALAALASGGAFWAAGLLVAVPTRLCWIPVLCCLPGLCGGLCVGLGLGALFQLPLCAWLRDTAVPPLLGATLLLLPLATVLCWVLDGAALPSRVHAARLLAGAPAGPQRHAGRALCATLVGRPRLCAWLILFAWIDFEVVAASMLAPVHMTPASVRLYNLMHYGQSSVLSALCALMVASLLLALGAAWLARLGYRVAVAAAAGGARVAETRAIR